MADLTETATFTLGVFQLEVTTPALGGPGAVMNAQAQALANRTTWLKAAVEARVTLAEVGAEALKVPRGAQLGSAAFVEAGALRGIFVTPTNAAYTIAPHQWGAAFLATSGAPTVTLPLASTVPVGWFCRVKARGTTMTVARSGSDTIDGATSLSVTTGNFRTIVRSGPSSFEVF